MNEELIVHKTFNYQMNLSKDDFCCKIKKFITNSQNRYSYEKGYYFYSNNSNIEDLKLTSESGIVMSGAFIPLIDIKVSTLATDSIIVSLIISLSGMCYFFLGLFDFMSIIFGVITYIQTINYILSLTIVMSFLLITNLIYCLIIRKYIYDAKERFEIAMKLYLF